MAKTYEQLLEESEARKKKHGRPNGGRKSNVYDRYKLNDMEPGEVRQYEYSLWLYKDLRCICRNKNAKKHGRKYRVRGGRDENGKLNDTLLLTRYQ